MRKDLVFSIVAVAVVFTGCNSATTVASEEPVVNQAKSLSGVATPTNTVKKTSSAVWSFSEAKVPETDAEKRTILSSDSVTIDGKEHDIGFNTIIRSGDVLCGNTYGLMYDKMNQAVSNKDGSTLISNSNDFASLLPVGDKLFMVSHFETRPGGMYLTELNQDKKTGKLTPINTKNIDFSAFNGLWVPCAGSVSPWGTHLGSEEYPPDTKDIDENGSIDSYYDPMARYVCNDLKALNPYDYGWTPEVKVLNEKGDLKVMKHYSMGRFAHELAYVMPDEKTVYLSDDGTNGVFYKFIADKEKDLSAGTLYAAKWNQISGANGGSANISWVSLGHATNAEISKVLCEKKVFSDIFDVAERNDDNTCPSGFLASNWANKNECLKVKEGMDVVASRLESGRYAGMMGATTEFAKMEGITHNKKNKEMYMSISRAEKGMEDNKYKNKPNTKYDKGGSNDIRLDERNHCGVVYKMALDAYNVTTMESMVVGTPMEKDADGNSCSLDNISMPDNLTLIPESNTLIIGEDTSYHQNDMIWAYSLDDKKLTRIQTTPYGSETTSPYFYPNVNGFGYLMSVVQHPFGESDEDKLVNPDEKRAYTGYIGPFPVKK